MRKDPSNPKYIRVEVRTDPIIREVGQTVETEDSMEIIDLDKTIGTTIFEGTVEDIEDKIIEDSIEIIGTMNIIKTEIGQERGHSREIMVTIGIGVHITVDQGQDLQLVLIEIG